MRVWTVVAGALVLVGLVAGCGLSASSQARDFIDGRYRRDVTQDVGTHTIAYTTLDPPRTVADDIALHGTPNERTGQSGTIVLRYDDYTVTIQATATGSLILVARVRRQ
jgi:hypothetical protein